MKNLLLTLLFILAAAIVLDMNKLEMARAESLPPLPEPVTNNAVLSVKAGGQEFVVSFAGMGPGKEHADAHAKTFVLDSETRVWHEAPPVPGGVGRLAATAIAVKDRA